MITYEVVDAEPLDIFLGVCRRCVRPLRETDTIYPLSSWADKHSASCPQCQRPVPMERVFGVEMGMNCDDRCMGATGNHCECACGGVNHGGIWSEKGQVLATALKAYRATAAKREANKVARQNDKQHQAEIAFKEWINGMPQRPLVEYLFSYRAQRDDGTEEYPNPFLDSLTEWLLSKKPLTEKQVIAGTRTMERRLHARQEAIKKQVADANPHTHPGEHLSNKQLTLGIFKYHGDVYVVKPNKKGTASYAMRMVEIHSDRLTSGGEKVHWEWEYTPGIVPKLTEADRLPVEDVQDLMIRYERCIVCHHPIKRAKTIERMMGKTCARKVGLL